MPAPISCVLIRSPACHLPASISPAEQPGCLLPPFHLALGAGYVLRVPVARAHGEQQQKQCWLLFLASGSGLTGQLVAVISTDGSPRWRNEAAPGSHPRCEWELRAAQGGLQGEAVVGRSAVPQGSLCSYPGQSCPPGLTMKKQGTVFLIICMAGHGGLPAYQASSKSSFSDFVIYHYIGMFHW